MIKVIVFLIIIGAVVGVGKVKSFALIDKINMSFERSKFEEVKEDVTNVPRWLSPFLTSRQKEFMALRQKQIQLENGAQVNLGSPQQQFLGLEAKLVTVRGLANSFMLFQLQNNGNESLPVSRFDFYMRDGGRYYTAKASPLFPFENVVEIKSMKILSGGLNFGYVPPAAIPGFGGNADWAKELYLIYNDGINRTEISIQRVMEEYKTKAQLPEIGDEWKIQVTK